MPAARLRSTSSSTSASVGVGASRRTLGAGPQHVDQGAELVERVLARGLDRGERALGQLGTLVDQVERGAGLHVDEREVVGHDVVELAGDAQLLLAGAESRFLLARPAARRRALASDADDLRRRRQHEEPRGEAERGGQGRGIPVPTSGGSQRNVHPPAHDRHPRHQPVPREHGGAERDDQREVDRALADTRARRTRASSRDASRAQRPEPASARRVRRHRPRAAARLRAEVQAGVLVRTATPHRRSRRPRPRPRWRGRAGVACVILATVRGDGPVACVRRA